jgi:hypothetical protein
MRNAIKFILHFSDVCHSLYEFQKFKRIFRNIESSNEKGKDLPGGWASIGLQLAFHIRLHRPWPSTMGRRGGSGSRFGGDASSTVRRCGGRRRPTAAPATWRSEGGGEAPRKSMNGGRWRALTKRGGCQRWRPQIHRATAVFDDEGGQKGSMVSRGRPWGPC